MPGCPSDALGVITVLPCAGPVALLSLAALIVAFNWLGLVASVRNVCRWGGDLYPSSLYHTARMAGVCQGGCSVPCPLRCMRGTTGKEIRQFREIRLLSPQWLSSNPSTSFPQIDSVAFCRANLLKPYAPDRPSKKDVNNAAPEKRHRDAADQFRATLKIDDRTPGQINHHSSNDFRN
jgi:hypothetical protein